MLAAAHRPAAVVIPCFRCGTPLVAGPVSPCPGCGLPLVNTCVILCFACRWWEDLVTNDPIAPGVTSRAYSASPHHLLVGFPCCTECGLAIADLPLKGTCPCGMPAYSGELVRCAW